MTHAIVLIPKETMQKLETLRAEYEHPSDKATLNLAFTVYIHFVTRKSEKRTLRGVDPDSGASDVIERNYSDLAIFAPSTVRLALLFPPHAVATLSLLMHRPHAAGDLSAMVVEAIMLLSDITEALKIWPEVGMFRENGRSYAEISSPDFATIRRKNKRP